MLIPLKTKPTFDKKNSQNVYTMYKWHNDSYSTRSHAAIFTKKKKNKIYVNKMK